MGEAILGVGGVVLAIIALTGALPEALMAITTIVIGAGLAFKGAALTARFSEILKESSEGRLDMAEFGSGMSAELVGGAGGVVLGILALLGLASNVLIASALIIYGGAIILGAGANARLNHLHISQREHESFAKHVAEEAVSSAAAVQLLIGMGGITLGVLALIGIETAILSAVGLLGIASAIVLSGSALTGRMLSALHT